VKHNDAEIEVLFRTNESDLVERKRSTNLKEEILEAICAFANDLPDHQRAGVIFIGVNDDGTCANQTFSEKTLREVVNWRNEGKIQPIPSIVVDRRTIDRCPVIVIQVMPSDIPPVRFDGRIKVGVGSTRTSASLADEIRLNEKRGARARPFDSRGIAELSSKDLDVARFEAEYLPNAVAPDILAANARTVEQRLAALRLTDPKGQPTPAAILMLGKTPQDVFPGSYVQALRIEGKSLTDSITDQKIITGTVIDQVRELDLLVRTWNRTKADMSGPVRRDMSDYPEVAIRQLVRNAIMHRTYEVTNSPIRLSWFEDRIEILSPGGPFGIVTPQNFGSESLTDYRNPSLADAMKTMGIVERFGFGISVARETCAANGNPPPEFDARPTHVLAKLRIRA
jgi:ATP-dependent DNA helicase RecG